MNRLQNYTGITWSVVRNFLKLSSNKEFCKELHFREISTKSLGINSYSYEKDNHRQNGELAQSRFVGTCLLSNYEIHYVQRRFKSMKGQGRSGKKQQKVKEKENFEKDEDSDDEDNVSETEIPEEDDPTLPRSYKERIIYAKTIRADSLLSAGLAFSRNRTDEVFYSSVLLLNGEKFLKKSKQVSVGDYVDFIVKREPEKISIQRVKLVKIAPQKTSKDKYVLTIRIWKAPFDVEVKEKKKIFNNNKS